MAAVRTRFAAALLTLAAACASLGRSSSDVPLRVATYNIQAGAGNLARTANAIRDLNADIIGLEEVDSHWSSRSGFADQPAELSTALGMTVRFAPIYSLPGTGASSAAREFGVALLSRYPIIEFRNDTITRLSTQDSAAVPRAMPGLLDAVIDVHGRRVRVFVTHLDYRADPRVRERQAAEMRALIDRSADPTIVFGDLNATPDAPELRPLFEALHDTWPPDAGAGLTYPATEPAKRIDYVLASRQFRATGASVPNTLASDHRPVVAQLVLSRMP